jgi:hypothetical protein
MLYSTSQDPNECLERVAWLEEQQKKSDNFFFFLIQMFGDTSHPLCPTRPKHNCRCTSTMPLIVYHVWISANYPAPRPCRCSRLEAPSSSHACQTNHGRLTLCSKAYTDEFVRLQQLRISSGLRDLLTATNVL